VVNRGNAVSSLITLYAALGGGWHTGEPLVDAATREQMEQRTNWGDLLNDSKPPSVTTRQALPEGNPDE
jgi:hypothetical protein